MKWLANLSLKYKIYLLLSSVSICVLLAFAQIALREFTKDKLLYIHDLSLVEARRASVQMTSDFRTFTNRAKFYLSAYSAKDSRFTLDVEHLFKQEEALSSLWVFKKNTYGKFEKSGYLGNQIAQRKLSEFLSGAMGQKLLEDIAQLKTGFTLLPSENLWLGGVVARDPDSDSQLIALGSMSADSYYMDLFTRPAQKILVLNGLGRPIFNTVGDEIVDFDIDKLNQTTKTALNNNQGASELKIGGTSYLALSVPISIGESRLIWLMDKRMAFSSLNHFLVRAVLLIVFFLFLTLAFSQLAARGITRRLQDLVHAVMSAAQGNLNVQLKDESKDEVGNLGRNFNAMTRQIQHLLSETREKARMENELKTAQSVQSIMFPQNRLSMDSIAIEGHYKSASECCGDWWSYDVVDNKAFIWIGDASGHGVPAALVSAIVCSASGVVRADPDLSLLEVVKHINDRVHFATQGKICMTLFGARIDLSTGLMEYVNASHESPFLLSPGSQLGSGTDLQVLNGNKCPRIGENAQSEFESTQIQLQPGDRVFLYTDGVTELINADGRRWGERRMLQTLLRGFSRGDDIPSLIEELNHEMSEFLGPALPQDDITYLVMDYRKPKRAA